MNSAESSRRFDFWDDDLRVNPATTDGRQFRDGEEKKSLGRKGRSLGAAKMFRSQEKTSEYKEEKGGIHSPLDTDATTTSTKSRTERHTFKDIDANELPLVLVQDIQAHEPERALPPEDAVFNIGIPLDFTLSEFKNQRKDHHRYILMGFAGSLREMMQSKENLPTFDEALEKIRMYTTSLVQAVGPPLDDWNALAQLVLRTLKERDDFFEFCTDRTSPIENITRLSLNADMRKCASTIDKDRGKLKDCKELLARALEKCASLEAELAKAQEISLSIAEQIKVVEQRITENMSSLEREGHCALLQQYEHVLSKLSAFTC